MKKAKLDVWARPDENEEEGFKLVLVESLHKWYMNESDINLGEIEVTYVAPANMTQQEITLKAIETLADKQKNVMAEAQKTVTRLQKKINELQFITFVETEDGIS